MGQGLTSVAFTELPGSPTFNDTLDGATGQRKLRVRWDDWPVACRELKGWAERTTAGKLKRWLPGPFPKIYGINTGNYPSLYAVSTSVEPFAPDWKDPNDPVGGGGANPPDDTPEGPVHRHRYAILTVGYSTLPYNVLADDAIASEKERFVNVTAKPSARMITLRGVDLVWDDAGITSGVNGKKINHDAVMIEAEETIQVAWHRLPYDAVASVVAQPGIAGGSAYLDNLVGCVNSDTFLGHAAGTLLFYPPDVQIKQDWYMGDVYEITMQLVRNRNGHNKIYLAADQAYRLVKSDAASGTRRIFAEAAFADAFKIP